MITLNLKRLAQLLQATLNVEASLPSRCEPHQMENAYRGVDVRLTCAKIAAYAAALGLPVVFSILTVDSGSACLDLLAFVLLYKYRQGRLLVIVHPKKQQHAAAHRAEQHHRL